MILKDKLSYPHTFNTQWWNRNKLTPTNTSVQKGEAWEAQIHSHSEIPLSKYCSPPTQGIEKVFWLGPASTPWEYYTSCLHFLGVLSSFIIIFGHIWIGYQKICSPSDQAVSSAYFLSTKSGYFPSQLQSLFIHVKALLETQGYFNCCGGVVCLFIYLIPICIIC